MVYEEMTKAVKQDRSIVHVHEISDLGLMQLSRQRVCILKSLLIHIHIFLLPY
jgi:Ribonuclease G/E